MTGPGHEHATAVHSDGARERSAAEASAAVATARRRARRAWRNQLLVVAVLTLLLGAGVWVVWLHSEIRAVRVHTTAVTPAPLPTGTVPATLTRAWRTDDRAAIGEPVWQDVVVTYAARTVSGRDARTGAVRWSYTRTDRRICDVAAEDGAVVAIYAHDGLCDEVTGLDAGSGERIWVRTLLSSGTPSDLRVSARSANIMLVTPRSIELIEPTGGLDWWYDDQPAACRTRTAVLGVSGVLMANGCGKGNTLSLRALGGAKQRAWTVPLNGRAPLSADALTSVLGPDGRSVEVVSKTSGRTTSTIKVTRAVEPPIIPAAMDIAGRTPIEVVAVKGGSLGIVKDAVPALLWQRAGALPTVAGQALLAAADTGVVLLDTLQGQPLTLYRAGGLSADDVVHPLGRGMLGSGTGGTAAYR